MSAQPSAATSTNVVICADGLELCLECADMFYHHHAGCSECGRVAASIDAVGASHKGCGGVFRALDSQRDRITRRVLRDGKVVTCGMCDGLLGGA